MYLILNLLIFTNLLINISFRRVKSQKTTRIQRTSEIFLVSIFNEVKKNEKKTGCCDSQIKKYY